MTVPGKGGRPRKWRSDTDRVRAFRARARGEDEPDTVDIALAAGDEAAVAWERVRTLGDELGVLRGELKSALSAAREAERKSEADQTRFGWIESDNERLRTELGLVVAERDELRRRLEIATIAARDSTPPLSTPPAAPSAPNRAQRRRQERERRRRSGGAT